ncbi:MAG: transposase [Limisphaerales bacterium]
MADLVSLLFSWLKTLRSDKAEVALENLALRQQLLMLQRQRPKPKARLVDRLFWVVLSRLWVGWQDVLELFQPKTVIGWQRRLFRAFWTWLSRSKGGRPKIDRETIALIRQMWAENPTLGAPKIRRELLKLGITVARSTIQKYKPQPIGPRDQKWMTFLRNHFDEMVAVDFFTVHTMDFRVLYVFVVMLHDRRKVLHFNITENPTALWTTQQIVNAFPFKTPPKYLLRDNDRIYGWEFTKRIEGLGMEEKTITPGSPWQSPYVERLIGTIRRECLDHFIIFNRDQLHRVLSQYLDYYHKIRPHKSLADDSPEGRAVQDDQEQKIVALPILGGLHHHYFRQAA